MTKEEKRITNLKAVKRYQNRNRGMVRRKWREYYYKNYNKWVNFLKELGYNKCSKCGYNKCFAALDFHHINGNSKENTISQLISCAFTEKRKQLLLKELDKCIVLCANCHRELHWRDK